MTLDPIVQMLLEKNEETEFPSIHSMPVETLRKESEEQARKEVERNRQLYPVAKITDRRIEGPGGELPIRIYTPEGEGPFPILIYFHGGGFVISSINTHDHICRLLCKGANCLVISVGYRYAPEHKFPAATDDALAATRWVADHAAELDGDAERMAVGGDSSGGNLATVTTLRIRDEGGPDLSGQLLIYPSTDHYKRPKPSHKENGEGYLTSYKELMMFEDLYLNTEAEADDPRFAPLFAADLERLPPALIITAEYDVVRDEGEMYAERLQKSGVSTKLSRYDGMIHAFISMLEFINQGKQAIEESCAWLENIFYDK